MNSPKVPKRKGIQPGASEVWKRELEEDNGKERKIDNKVMIF